MFIYLSSGATSTFVKFYFHSLGPGERGYKEASTPVEKKTVLRI